MFSDYTIVGDPHLTHKTLDKAETLFNTIENLGLPTVWLGDLLDTKEIIRGKCLNAIIAYLSRSKLRHIFLIGNHDWFNLECQDHALQALKLLPNVTVVDKPTMFEDFLCIPYYKDSVKLKEVLKEAAGIKTVFCHIDVSGFDYGNGHLCEDGLSLEDLKSFGLVVSGHFHKYQIQDNLIYLGTPFSHSFGETDQNKFIGIWNSGSNTIRLLDSPFPRHVTMKLNIDDPNWFTVLQKFLDHNSKNIKRVQLYGKPELCAQFDKSKYCDYDIKFEDKSETSKSEGVNLDESLDNKTQFMVWSRDIRHLDPETSALGLSILEALSAKRN